MLVDEASEEDHYENWEVHNLLAKVIRTVAEGIR